MQTSVFCEVENGLTNFLFAESWKRISSGKLRENVVFLIVRDTTLAGQNNQTYTKSIRSNSGTMHYVKYSCSPNMVGLQ